MINFFKKIIWTLLNKNKFNYLKTYEEMRNETNLIQEEIEKFKKINCKKLQKYDKNSGEKIEWEFFGKRKFSYNEQSGKLILGDILITATGFSSTNYYKFDGIENMIIPLIDYQYYSYY